MKLSLIVSQEGKEGKEIPIRLSQFLIGRDPQCHLRPASTLISKRHCALLVREGKVYLRDFDSTNGTFLNKQALKGEIEVGAGDEIQVGPLTFQVKIGASLAVDAPTPLPPSGVKAAVAGATVKQAAAKVGVSIKRGPGDSDEDIFADLLMNIPDDPNASAKTLSGNDPISPDSTIFQMPTVNATPLEIKKEQPASEATPANVAVKTEDAKKKAINQQATSDAAKAILEKYMKRPRPAGR